MQPPERIFLEISIAVPQYLKEDGALGPLFFSVQKHLQIVKRHPPSNQEPAPPASVAQASGVELQVQDNRDAVLPEPARPGLTSTSNDETQQRGADDRPLGDLDERPTSTSRVDEQPRSLSSARPWEQDDGEFWEEGRLQSEGQGAVVDVTEVFLPRRSHASRTGPSVRMAASSKACTLRALPSTSCSRTSPGGSSRIALHPGETSARTTSR